MTRQVETLARHPKRGKAHRITLVYGQESAACGAGLRDKTERVPATQPDPSDLCARCFPAPRSHPGGDAR